MPIKFSCGSCGSTLRVAEQHIGKQAKCPKCSEKCVVPPQSELDQTPAQNIPAQQSAAPQQIAPTNAGRPTKAVPTAKKVKTGPPNFGPPSAAAPETGPFNIGPPQAAAASTETAFPSFGESHTPAASSVPAFGSPPVATNPPADESPFAAPMAPGSSGGSLSNTVMHPLYQVRGMMNWFGWFLFVIGCIYCITIVGAIIGWLPLWMGSLVKGASKSIKLGVEQGDENQLRLANQRLATFFKICGVITIIYICLIGIWLVLFMAAIIIGAVNGGV